MPPRKRTASKRPPQIVTIEQKKAQAAAAATAAAIEAAKAKKQEGKVTITRTDAEIAAQRTSNSAPVINNNISVTASNPAARRSRSRSPSRDRKKQRRDESRQSKKRSRSRSKSRSRERNDRHRPTSSPRSRKPSPQRRVRDRPRRSFEETRRSSANEEMDRIRRLEDNVAALAQTLVQVQEHAGHQAVKIRTGEVKEQIEMALKDASIDINDFCKDVGSTVYISSTALVDELHTIALVGALRKIDRKFTDIRIVFTDDEHRMRKERAKKIQLAVDAHYTLIGEQSVLTVENMGMAENICRCCEKSSMDLTCAHLNRAPDLTAAHKRYKPANTTMSGHIEDAQGVKTDLNSLSSKQFAFLNIESSADRHTRASTDNQQTNAREKKFPSVLTLQIDPNYPNDVSAVMVGFERYELVQVSSKLLLKAISSQGAPLAQRRLPAPPVTSSSGSATSSAATPSYPSSRNSQDWIKQSRKGSIKENLEEIRNEIQEDDTASKIDEPDSKTGEKTLLQMLGIEKNDH